jgi:cyclopropane-fatty-acyl-phospholipid synthase
MVLFRTKNGTLTFVLPNGTVHLKFRTKEDGPEATINVHNFRFVNRALSGGDVAFAESYMDGDWSTPDLTAVLRFFSANFDSASRSCPAATFSSAQ